MQPNSGGVSGIGDTAGSTGVYGRGANLGVFGTTTSGTGVSGNSTGGRGVYGVSATASTTIAGVWGENSVAGGTGVVGKALAANGGGVTGIGDVAGSTGVYGRGATLGVFGTSTNGMLLVGVAFDVTAGPRTSASYAIITDVTDSGGARATSAAYSNNGSFGGIAGLSTVAAPVETAKSGYLGQLYEIVGLALNATPATLDENGTRQLSAGHLLDDTTTLAVNASSVAWSVAGAPIASISAAGLATAGIVYQNTPATAQGVFSGFTGSLNLTVLDVIADNFGTYASDGVGDDWQVQYFGQPPNANAGPLVDFDRDGQNHAFEYTAGLIPTDATSVFRLRLEAIPAQSGQKRVIFSPRLTDRTYTVKAKASLLTVGGWTPITGSAPNDAGQERTITDLSASGAAKFYQVEITKP